MLDDVSTMRNEAGKEVIRVLMSSKAPGRLVKVPNSSTWREVNEFG